MYLTILQDLSYQFTSIAFLFYRCTVKVLCVRKWVQEAGLTPKSMDTFLSHLFFSQNLDFTLMKVSMTFWCRARFLDPLPSA